MHVSVAFDPSFTVTSELVISELMSGGTAIETMLKYFWVAIKSSRENLTTSSHFQEL